MGASELGRMLLIIGGILVILGLIVIVGGRLLPLGRLPGDILWQRGNLTFYFPLATALLASLLLTIILNLLLRR